MAVSEYKPFTGFVSEPKGVAALGQKGLPIGPVLPISGGYTEGDIKDQKEKNEKELPVKPAETNLL